MSEADLVVEIKVETGGALAALVKAWGAAAGASADEQAEKLAEMKAGASQFTLTDLGNETLVVLPEVWLSQEAADELPKAYGGCSCNCHRWAGVKHCVPCCYPSDPHGSRGPSILRYEI